MHATAILHTFKVGRIIFASGAVKWKMKRLQRDTILWTEAAYVFGPDSLGGGSDLAFHLPVQGG